MQLRLVSSPTLRLPQRPQSAEEASARATAVGEDPTPRRRAGESTSPYELSRVPVSTASDNARREYYYSRVETVAGRTAQALKNYTDIEDAAGRDQLRDQLGLDTYA